MGKGDKDDDFKKVIDKKIRDDNDEMDSDDEKDKDPSKKDRMFCKPLPKSYFVFIEKNKTFWRVLLGSSVVL